MSVKDTLLAVSGLLGGNSGGGGGGGEAVLVNKTVSANGTYLPSADNADGYKKVVVNVPTPTPTLTTKTITANGTYAASSDNADGYSSVTVAVPEPVDGLIAGTWPSGAVSTAATGTLRAYAFYNNTAMTAFSGPNISSVGNYAFYGNTALSVVHLPEVETVGESAFQYAHVEYLVLPSCHTLGAISVKGSSNHKVLKALDLGGEITDSSQGIRGTYVFGDRGIQFNTVILRSGAVVPLVNTNSFNGTAFYTGLGPSTIYVPQALIDAYTNATNWSTVIARTNVTIAAIEGSVYETQYADGTPIA